MNKRYFIVFYEKRCGLRWGVFYEDENGIEHDALYDLRFWRWYTAARIANSLTCHFRNGVDIGNKQL